MCLGGPLISNLKCVYNENNCSSSYQNSVTQVVGRTKHILHESDTPFVATDGYGSGVSSSVTGQQAPVTPCKDEVDSDAPPDSIPASMMAAKDQDIRRVAHNEIRPDREDEHCVIIKSSCDFDIIRNMCNLDDPDYVGPEPHELATHRASKWPDPAALPDDLAQIYRLVRDTGIPNALGVRIPIPSKLNIDEWEALLSKSGKYDELLDFVKFGFPMGYLGPESPYDEKYNHSSAVEHPKHIEEFIKNEIMLGGIVGPMPAKPFDQWIHTAPLMTRPKRDSEARRVIAYLSFPEKCSVNGYILKKCGVG